nr:100K protein [Lemur mastadenovirus]WGN96536.1 100K protein [Lemur mastadenovirus]
MTEEQPSQPLEVSNTPPEPSADEVLTPPPSEEPDTRECETAADDCSDTYLSEEMLLKHLHRQSQIVLESLGDRLEIPSSVRELSLAFEQNLFSPKVPPKKQENGTCEPNPRLNFYPCFMIPEVLATYHLFFHNAKIPISCRANRARADKDLTLKEGDKIPTFCTVEEVPKIFEGLGLEEVVSSSALEESDSVLVELKADNPRLAVLKRSISVTHFAYPALNLPPKIMKALMEQLIMKHQEPVDTSDPEKMQEQGEKPVVSDEELAKWLASPDPKVWEERRKTMMAIVLVSLNLQCMEKFFVKNVEMIRKLSETIHYTFRHGYVKQACKTANLELTNMVSYMGILHENRLGQSVLHHNLKGESRRDYVRDTIFLLLVYTWQTAMGVWQQCLEDTNVKELEKILKKEKRNLWGGFDEATIGAELANIIFPEKLLQTLQAGLPDFTSQSMLQNFRSFILERSGILPAMANALPTDFVPLRYKECPPPLWSYTYLLRLANFLMYHSDVAEDVSGEGLLECYCRCNLCTPHRSLATNTALLNEIQSIGTFEIQGPPGADGAPARSLKLTPGMWASAYLRKFVPEDFHAHKIAFYENQSKPSKSELTACVITQASILAQLQEIKKAREEFLLKKGHGVYLDPQTGEELNGSRPSPVSRHGTQEPDNETRGGGLDERERLRNRGGKRRRLTTKPTNAVTPSRRQPADRQHASSEPQEA